MNRTSTAPPHDPTPGDTRRRRTCAQPATNHIEGTDAPSRLHSPSQWFQWLLTNTIRLVVLVAGTAVVGAGVAMLVLPGPGILVILFGLVILTTQFVWAERALDRMTVTTASVTNTASTHRGGRILLGLSGTTTMVGGGLVVVLIDEHRLAGATALLSGLIGLGTLLPSVRRWVARRADPAVRAPSPATPLQPDTTSGTSPQHPTKEEPS